MKHSSTFLIVAAILVIPACPAAISKNTSPSATYVADAHALLVLHDSTMEIKGRRAVLERRVVKKILASGHPEQGVFRFPSDRYTKIASIRGHSTGPDGRKRKLDTDDILVAPNFEDFVLYSESKVHLVDMGPVVEGTVIDITVRWELENLVYWEPAVFQRGLPMETCRYTLIVPETFRYRVKGLHMSDRPTREGKLNRGRRQLVWEQRHVPAVGNEERMPPPFEFVPVLWFTSGESGALGVDLTLTAWADIVDWYRRLAAPSLSPDPEIEAVVRNACAGLTGDMEKARRLYNWVQENLRYVAIYLGLDGYRPHVAGDVLENRYGDCKDQSVVLASMLAAAGLSADLVAVRTADMGLIDRPLPTPLYFNHLIVRTTVDGHAIFLDPTCASCSFGVLPLTVQGAHALVIRPGVTDLVRLPEAQLQPNAWRTDVDVDIDADGTGRITRTITARGHTAARIRREYAQPGGRSDEELARELFLSGRANVEFETVSMVGREATTDSLSVTLVYTVPGFLDVTRRVTFWSPLTEPITGRLPDCEDRRYPIAFDTAYHRTLTYRLNLPHGWQVPELPDHDSLDNAWCRYACMWRRDGEGIVMWRTWQRKKARVEPGDCVQFQEDVRSLIQSQQSKLLIVKE